jgi:riboflavin kinase/FMN adenylyltransferase
VKCKVMKMIPLSYPLQLREEELSNDKKVLAIGDFDGVHLGHQEVIRRATQTAERLRLPASIMTFHPHPRQVLGQDKYKDLLTPIAKKMQLFEKLGVHYTYVAQFDEALMGLTPGQFVNQVLLPLGVESVIVGFDFTFGFQGKGNPDTLCELGHGKFAVEVVRPFHIEGAKVSSTSVREALQQGQVEKATQLLGRRYCIQGEVITGDQRGRTIGFPTANIRISEPFVTPRTGVYAIKAEVKGQRYDGVMNIGYKPTFNQDELTPSLEAHLFGFSQNIYGETMSVELVSFLREERRFSGIQELVDQIKQDAETSKSILMSHP